MQKKNLYEQPLNKESDIILFFQPDAGIKPHYVAQCVVAKTLQERGYQVLFARCTGQFNRCPVVDMHRLPYNTVHPNICQDCVHLSAGLLTHYQLPHIELAKYASQDMVDTVNSLMSNAGDDLLNVKYDGFSFGRLGSFDTHLILKRMHLDKLEQEHLEAWRAYTMNSLFAYLLLKKICEELPIRRFAIFNSYSLLSSTKLASIKLGIPVIYNSQPAHKGIDRDRYVLMPEVQGMGSWDKYLKNWYRWRDIPISDETVHEIANDQIMRQAGTKAHHYSPSKSIQDSNIIERLSLDPNKKLLVAYTSSMDELASQRALMEAADEHYDFTFEPFKDQIDWLKHLIEHVGTRDDLQLVVRVHPREASNKREQTISEHFNILQEHFADKTFKNCRIIWSQENVSSYDLAEVADLVLTSWSSMGMELSKFGIPILTAFRHLSYCDDDFMYWGGESVEEYFGSLDALLLQPAQLELIIRSFRAYNYLVLCPTIYVGDIPKNPADQEIPMWQMPKEAELIEKVFASGRWVIEEMRVRHLEAVTNDSVAEEAHAVLRELQRMIHCNFTGEDIEGSIEITRVELPPETEVVEINEQIEKYLHSGNSMLLVAGYNCYYIHQGKVYQRWSKLLSRLAPVCTVTSDSSSLKPMMNLQGNPPLL